MAEILKTLQHMLIWIACNSILLSSGADDTHRNMENEYFQVFYINSCNY